MSIHSQPKCLYENGFQSLDLVAGAIFLVPLVFTSTLNDHFVFPKFLYLGVLAFFAVVILSIRSLKEGIFPVPSCRMFSFFALWTAWLGCVSLIGEVPAISMRAWMIRLLSLFILYFFAIRKVPLRIVVFVVAFVSFVISGLGLLQFYGLDVEVLPHFRISGIIDLSNLVMMDRPENQEKIYSTFGHRNYLSGYLLLSVPLLIAWLIHCIATVKQACTKALLSRKCVVHIFSGVSIAIIIGMSLWTILLTRTRGAFLGCAFALFLFGVLLRYCRVFPFDGQMSMRRRKMFAVIALVSIIAVLWGAQQPLWSLYGKLAKGLDPSTGSWGHRIMIWQAAVAMIQDSPGSFLLGLGAGSFQTRHIECTGRIFQDALYKGKAGAVIRSWYVHNEYLNVWVDSGFIGVLLFGAFIISLLMVFWRIVLQGMELQADGGDKREDYYLCLGMICGVVGVLLHNVVSFTLQLPSTSSLFFAYCGLLLSVSRQVCEVQSSQRGIVPACLGVATIGLFGLMLDTGGEFYLRRAAVLTGARRMDRAQKALRKAASLRGFHPETIQRIGDFYFTQRNFAESLRAYRLFLSSIEDCEVRFREALCLFELGKQKQGKESIAKVLRNNPLHREALQVQARFFPSSVEDAASSEKNVK